jgi:hypothetical protein
VSRFGGGVGGLRRRRQYPQLGDKKQTGQFLQTPRFFFHFFTVSQKVKQNKYGVSDVTLIALEAVCQQGCVLRANKNRKREEFSLQELRPNLKVSPVESWP